MQIPSVNRQINYIDQPKGKLGPEHFEQVEGAVQQPGQGELLVRTILLALDAATRAHMQGETYRAALQPGDLMPARGIGEVVVSNAVGFSPGDIVIGDPGWQDYSVADAGRVRKATRCEPLSHLLSVYGIPGLTAYHGLIQVGKPAEGETVVVSAAAGSIGTLTGQIAKSIGCRAVGIAGGPEKCRWLVDELGYDAAIDYKNSDVLSELQRVCPKGVDIYFDCVGGEILGTLLSAMNMKGRIVCCGAVSQYDTAAGKGPQGIPLLITLKRLRMEGFLAVDFPEADAEAVSRLSEWMAVGKLKVIEHITEGLENAPSAFIGMLNGQNRGKAMVRVAPDPE